MNDNGPVLLWTVRYGKVGVQECDSIDSAARTSAFLVEEGTAAPIGAEAPGVDGVEWHDSDSLRDRAHAMWRERAASSPSPPIVARIEITSPPQFKGHSVVFGTYSSWAEADADYERLRATVGDRVALIQLEYRS